MKGHGFRGRMPLPKATTPAAGMSLSRQDASPTKSLSHKKRTMVFGQNCICVVGAASCREIHPTEKGFGCKNVFSKQTTKEIKI